MKAIFLALILCFTQNLFAESSAKSADSAESIAESAKSNADSIAESIAESTKSTDSTESIAKSIADSTDSATFNEDAYILEALEASDLGDDKRAIELYDALYKHTKKIEYLKERLFALVRMEKHTDALNVANEVLGIAPQDLEALKVKAMLLRDDLDATIEILQKVVALENNAINNVALANLYMQKNDPTNARKCLIRAYDDRSDDSILLLLVSIDLKAKKIDLELLRAHFGDEMGEVFAQLLLEIGKDELSLLEAVFVDFYTRKQTPTNAKNLAKLYYLQNRIDKIEAMEKDGGLDADIALDIYIDKKDFERAENLAKREFSRTKKKHYLGMLGIITFERAQNRAQRQAKIHEVVQNLTDALSESPNHNFANYLGYLLIDYDIDIQKGIWYVKEALDASPQNFAYLDSLAWGYFKQGDCKEANAVMEKIPLKTIEGEAELKGHLEDIKKCLKKS